MLYFMFHTNDVTEEVAEKSETLLTKLMQDNREWIWVEVDSCEDPHVPDKVIGAMGYDPDDPYNRLIVKLSIVHKDGGRIMMKISIRLHLSSKRG